MARVLIVDDDPATRLLVRTVLTHAGHTVVEAATGRDGLAQAALARPDLILIDLSMPSMSGADFVRQLRMNPQCGTSALALYTATPMNAALRDFVEMYGIAHVLPKPSEPHELAAAVDAALAASGANS
jgi:CheY-like chemotaxis protein